MDIIPMFTTTDIEINQGTILTYHGTKFDQDFSYPNGKKVRKAQISIFFDELEKINRTNIIEYLIFTPNEILKSDITTPGETHSIRSYEWTNPYIILKKHQFSYMNNGIKSEIEQDYILFKQNLEPITFKEIVSADLDEFVVFYRIYQHSNFAELQNFLNDIELKDIGSYEYQEIQNLIDQISVFHRVYQPHILTRLIKRGLKSNHLNFHSQEVFGNTQYNIQELNFMYNTKYKFTVFKNKTIDFYDLADLYSEIVYQDHSYLKENDIFSNIEMLALAINYEYRNPYPSNRLAKYYNMLSILTDLHPEIQKLSPILLQFGYYKLIGYINHIEKINRELKYDDVSFVLVISKRLNDEKKTKQKSLPYKFWSHQQNYSNIIRKSLTLINRSEIDFKLKIFLAYIERKINTNLKKQSFRSVQNLYNELITNDLKIDKIDINLDLARRVVYVIKLMEIYLYYLTELNLNPNDIIIEERFDEVILNKYRAINEEIDPSILQDIYQLHIAYKIFPKVLKITDLLYSKYKPNEILSQINHLLLEDRKRGKQLLMYLKERVITFLILHLDDLNLHTISSFFEVLELNKSNYMTLDMLIKRIIYHIFRDEPLFEIDYKFLREFIEIDDDDDFDNSKGNLKDLLFKLQQLKNETSVEIPYEDGTISELKTSQSSDTRNDGTPEDPGSLPVPPLDIFDLFDDESDLDNYLKLFYAYYKAKKNFEKTKDQLHEEFKRDTPEFIYYNLLNVSPEKELLGNYHGELSKLKKENKHIVDDISVELLNIRLVLTSHPTFALPQLDQLQETMRNRDCKIEDWKELFELYQVVLLNLELKDLLEFYSLQENLLDYFSSMQKNPGFLHDYIIQIKIPDYLDILQNLTSDLAHKINKFSDLEQFIQGVISHQFSILNNYITKDLNPFIEVLCLLHLSWDNSDELHYLISEYFQVLQGDNNNNDIQELRNLLNLNSNVWQGGFIIGTDAVQIRIAELEGVTLTEDLVRILPQLVNSDDRIKTLLLISRYYKENRDHTNLQILLDYITSQVFGLDANPREIDNFLIEIVELSQTLPDKQIIDIIETYFRENNLEKGLTDLDKIQEKLPPRTIENTTDQTGIFPEIDKIINDHLASQELIDLAEIHFTED